jgi:hypothetical protein
VPTVNANASTQTLAISKRAFLVFMHHSPQKNLAESPNPAASIVAAAARGTNGK